MPLSAAYICVPQVDFDEAKVYTFFYSRKYFGFYFSIHDNFVAICVHPLPLILFCILHILKTKKYMKLFKKFFSRKPIVSSENGKGETLSVEGISPAPITPSPDDAELAAQALLEIMASKQSSARDGATTEIEKRDKGFVTTGPDGGVSFYTSLANKIRQNQEESRLRTLRFVAFCEQELTKEDLPAYGPGSLGLLEKELLKRIDVVNRCGGELKKRWQYCLSEVIVKMVNHDERKDEALKD